MRTVLEARQQRGLELATTVKIVRKRNEWIVPSQSGKGRYRVRAISKRKFSAIAQTMKPMEASASTSLLFSIFSNSIYLIPM